MARYLNVESQIKYTGKGPLDYRSLPVKTVADLPLTRFAYEGETKVVLIDKDGEYRPMLYRCIKAVKRNDNYIADEKGKLAWVPAKDVTLDTVTFSDNKLIFKFSDGSDVVCDLSMYATKDELVEYLKQFEDELVTQDRVAEIVGAIIMDLIPEDQIAYTAGNHIDPVAIKSHVISVTEDIATKADISDLINSEEFENAIDAAKEEINERIDAEVSGINRTISETRRDLRSEIIATQEEIETNISERVEEKIAEISGDILDVGEVGKLIEEKLGDFITADQLEGILTAYTQITALSGYATTEAIEAALRDFATKEDIASLITEATLDNYVKKSELEETIEEIAEKIGAISGGTGGSGTAEYTAGDNIQIKNHVISVTGLDAYATDEELAVLDRKIDSIAGGGEGGFPDFVTIELDSKGFLAARISQKADNALVIDRDRNGGLYVQQADFTMYWDGDDEE